ncbi:WAT1-related protein At4g15540-like [Momordica charantia]|uniref:WAT1-related protein n=1 Tax=Momordica charantia TaxID=3673 RepID=A0A6J1D9Q1_MOMCH|nr:WAT1-related protein At4g15540-like [Momordica charantia]
MVERWIYKDVVPFAGMVAAECATVGSNTGFKAATAAGITYYVFTLYVAVVAAAALLPVALIFRRRSPSPKLPPHKISFFFKIVCLSALGLSCQLFGNKGLEYSSPNLSSAISNLIPAFTFVLAIFFRMEKVAFKKSSSIAKMVGSAVSISGALVVVLYKGPIVISNPYSEGPKDHTLGSSQSQPNWILGGLCFVFQYVCNSLWYILQTQIIKIYPDELSVLAVYYVIQALLTAPVCLLAETDINAWKLTTPLHFLLLLNSGLVGQCFVASIHTWGLGLKGPVYVSSFRPLSIAIAAAMGAILLGDDLHLGSIIGAIIISVGFYGILWGKAKEEELKELEHVGTLESSSKAPLLQCYKVEDA